VALIVVKHPEDALALRRDLQTSGRNRALNSSGLMSGTLAAGGS